MSATSLLTSGSSSYVFEWLACAKKIASRWPNVKVCPLVPLWTESAPGQFIRSLQELSSVFRSLFGGDPRGLGPAWILRSECIGEAPHPAGNTQQTIYSLPYLTSLSGQCSIKNHFFTTNQGCPATASQLCCMAKSQIVCRLAEELNASLSAGIYPGIIAERVASAGGAADAKDKDIPPLLSISSFSAPATCPGSSRT